ncbi:hypothetical protein [Yoonia sp. I 8.24]|uniref:hypothetical protein n=1 Tax=Yoonia sp. I 8.24 TaxID=1537229 RepID=UPI001EE1224B|nr:hypothetical protein [Yoonia sp. I 8.24]MCG3266931.1 hypothetical protein [Yoonia sp. I 8.24]
MIDQSNQMRISSILFTAMLLSSSATAQDTPQHFEHPANRLVFFEVGGQSVAYWPERITAQFIGITNLRVQQRVLADTIYYGNAANTEINILGFPNTMFAESLPISNDANFVVFIYDLEDESALKSGDFRHLGLGTSFDRAEPNNDQGYGYGGMNDGRAECFYAVFFNAEGGLEAFALAISSSSSEEDALRCVRDGVPTGFGFNPYISEYHFELDEGTDEVTTFYDRSEFTLGLMAASFCRNEVDDNSISCIAELIHSTYMGHSQLLDKYAR